MKNVGQCFLRSGTVAEFLDETGVSLRGRITTNDSRGPDAKVELAVEGVSVTVAQNIQCSGESGNALLDLSVSVMARLLDSFGKLERRELCTAIGRTLVTCLSQVHPEQHRSDVNMVCIGVSRNFPTSRQFLKSMIFNSSLGSVSCTDFLQSWPIFRFDAKRVRWHVVFRPL